MNQQPHLQYLSQLLSDMPIESQWILFEDLQHEPEKKIYAALIQLEQDVLRPMLKTKGKDSKEYQFFMRLKNICYQAAESQYIIDKLSRQATELQHLNEYLMGKNAQLSNELSTYTTIEHLVKTEALDRATAAVRQKMKAEYERKLRDAQQNP